MNTSLEPVHRGYIYVKGRGDRETSKSEHKKNDSDFFLMERLQ